MSAEIFLNGRVQLCCGDSMHFLQDQPENRYDSCITDPPYHLQSIVKRFAKTGRTDKTRTTSGPHQRTANGFMNKVWDGGDIAFRVSTWEKVFRVLKPGAYIVAFSSSRTFGRMSVAIEDAGFITLPLTGWIFGQGFPKAHRVHAEGWEGFRYGGQVTKPALEPIYIGQKPFSEKTGTANVLRWGCGAMNIDACRIQADETLGRLNHTTSKFIDSANGSRDSHDRTILVDNSEDKGRWPANVMTDGSPEVFAAFPETTSGTFNGNRNEDKFRSTYGEFKGTPEAETPFEGSTGSAARFFWSSKAGSDDRLGSSHPTVKPVDLIQELCRLYTPPGGLVLDPFAGTGTTAEACYREGMRCMLVERETEYQADIRRRMVLVLGGPDERRRESIKAKNYPVDHGPLFAEAAE